MRRKDLDRLVSLGCIECEHHSDTHVEDIEHFPVGNLAIFLKETEDWKNLPAAFLDLYAHALVKDTRYVLVESASRDVSHTVDIAITDDIQHLLHIDACRSQGNFSKAFLLRELRIFFLKIQLIVREYFTNKAEAV